MHSHCNRAVQLCEIFYFQHTRQRRMNSWICLLVFKDPGWMINERPCLSSQVSTHKPSLISISVQEWMKTSQMTTSSKCWCDARYVMEYLFAYWVIFACSYCRLLVFFKINFFLNSFRSTIRVSNSLDSTQAWHFLVPDLGPICLQRLSANDTSSKELGNGVWKGYND